MFDQLFSRPFAVNRHRSAPHAEDRERYLQHLVSQGYSTSHIKRIAFDLLGIALQTDLGCKRRVTADMIREGISLRHSLRGSSRRRLSAALQESLRRTATAWFVFLGRFAADKPVTHTSAVVTQFEAFLRDERGFARGTIYRYCWHAQRFLDELGQSGGTLRRVRLEDVDAYIAARAASGWQRRSMPAVTDALRSFLRFGELRKLCKPGLAVGVQSPRMYTDERLPEGLEWSAVTQIIASARGNTPRDLRDRAILLLLSMYGLRAGEIAVLRLEDIDWENETISIRRPKQRHTQLYPLDATTGEAI